MKPDEQGLIDKALAGDKEAFSALVREYQNRIFGFIMRMTANRDAALDLTQETFLAAWNHLDSFRKEASFSTWLHQIAANRTKNYLKRAKRETGLPEDFEVAADTDQPDTGYERKQQEHLLKTAVATLPYKQRLTFTLRYFEQMKFREIARAQGISVSAAKTNFAEALNKLKKKLRPA
jgi:RNA polymerase sigma-70 factor (ECF subfamily)